MCLCLQASGQVFDELAKKAIPNLTDPKAKDSKPKVKTTFDFHVLFY